MTDEELIEGLSFLVYQRVSTAIIVPAQSHQASSVEMVPIDPRDLQSAQDQDKAGQQFASGGSKTTKRQVVGFRRRQGLNKVQMALTDKTIDLDQHRGMAAQNATDLRRLLAYVEADQSALRLRQDELEAAPAANWREAAQKARYLLSLLLR